ncbi:MAG TPA: L,D-transpeptidase [Bradyrhizobium sp.]|nr:L,D-transpeptidase [Bradyrhizobium sp.]
MNQIFVENCRPSPRILRTLIVAVGSLLALPILGGDAGAQVLGYASAPQGLPSPDSDDATPAQDRSGSVVPQRLRRAVVAVDTSEAPGTIIIDSGNTVLYYVLGQGRAIRYGVGVGREGFAWSGVQTVSRKAEWPDWYPPAEMIARQPYLPRFVAGGPGNPLGARAMYLGTSAYRIHGTNDASTIGKFVSSGCIRLTNEDVADLFDRVEVGTKVVVLPKNSLHLETSGAIGARAVSAQPRLAVTRLPSGRAVSLSTSALY